MSAASAARKASKDAEITVITEDEDIAYSPCAIPWGIEGRTGWDDIVMHDPEFYRQSRGIEVVTRTRVESVDGEKREVAAGGRTYPYDSLVVAAGGTVFVPPIEGKDLGNVFVVRTVRDGKNIQRALEGAENVVIGGAGVIGLELAVALREEERLALSQELAVPKPRAQLDLRSLEFAAGGHLMSKNALHLPEGTNRVLKPGWEEIHVPAAANKYGDAEYLSSHHLVSVEEMPEWFRPGFEGVSKLNLVQSEVYECAMLSSVCVGQGRDA